MGPWVHGGWSRERRLEARRRVVQRARRPSSTASRSSCRSSSTTSRARAKPKHPKAWVFETGTNVWRKHDAWPPQKAKPRPLYFHAGGKLGDEPPAEGKPEDGRDEYVSDPAQAGALPEQDRHRHGGGVHDGRPALRLAPARRAGLSDRRAGRRRDHRRADPGRPVRLDDGHRLRLGGQGDRRLSQRLSRPEPEPDGREDGRLSATGARRRDARQVPQQLREAGAVRAGQADAR